MVEKEIGEGRRVAIIRELSMVKGLLMDCVESNAALLRGRMQEAGIIAEKIYPLARAYLRENDRALRGITSVGDAEQKVRPFWGYEGVLGLNATKRLVMVHERTTCTVVARSLRHWIASNCNPETDPVKASALMLGMMSESAFGRDRAVYFQAAGLASSGYDTIIIPRGILHSPMSGMFMEGRFRKEIVSEGIGGMVANGVPMQLYLELMARRYCRDGPLPKETIMEFATRQTALFAPDGLTTI